MQGIELQSRTEEARINSKESQLLTDNTKNISRISFLKKMCLKTILV